MRVPGRGSVPTSPPPPAAQSDPRSDLATMLLTEGMKEAMARSLAGVTVRAILEYEDELNGRVFDVVDSFYGTEGVTLVLRRQGS